mmetsp:Transcript_19600/g.14314  ORF Transcript_19600/g.14314 Transcript_19600/m.14314 type:complete len:154 (+) Transcript_19600:623-1084(+)
MPANADAEVDCLFLIDRAVDLVSPFCVNQNYEGLLDEFFCIKTQTITVDTVLVKPDAYKDPKNPPAAPTVMLLLTNEDMVFKEVRNRHFTNLESYFSKKLQEISDMMKRGNNPNDIGDIDALQDYISKLKDMNIVKVKEMITNHVNLASHINQ